MTLSFPMVSSLWEAKAKDVLSTQTHRLPAGGELGVIPGGLLLFASPDRAHNADADTALGNQLLSPNLTLLAWYTWPNIWTEFWQNIKELREQRKIFEYYE